MEMQFDSAPPSGEPAWRRFAYRLMDLPLLLGGLLVFSLRGRTPRPSYHAMRRISGASNGGLNRAWRRWAALRRPAAAPVAVDGFLGRIAPEEIEAIAARLRSDGFCPIERALSPGLCDELVEFARREPSLPMGASERVVYSESAATALRQDFDEAAILRSPAACRIVFDGTLSAIAAAYFGARPIYDFTAMWWTTSRGTRDLSRAAQEFHYDMDRPFFLKFFFYLTDVTPRTGPHVFVPGSHRDKPAPLRAPRRYADEEIRQHFPADRVLEILGQRGTLFAVDTSAFHKGMPVVEGHRLALQVEFTISRFGQNYPQAIVSRRVLQAAGLPEAPDPDVFRVRVVD